MKNKSSDISYCGVRKQAIRSARPVLNQNNVQFLAQWIFERYTIHLNKDVKQLSAPWTNDPVLSQYRFCNVRREHDKESRWLIKHIATNNALSYKNKILNCILFRLYNKSETLAVIGPQDFAHIQSDKLAQQFAQYKKAYPRYVFFSNAFFMSGPKTAANKLFGKTDVMALHMIRLVQKYQARSVVTRVQACTTQKQVYETLRALPGIGEFLAYQIFVDFTYIPEFPFSENEFTVAGPGCKKGLDLIFSNRDELTYEEALFWLRDHQQEVLGPYGYRPQTLFTDLPSEERILNVMSLENCMCEISKYIRARSKTGRPRVRYKY